MTPRILTALFLALALPGCATLRYDSIAEGTGYHGKIRVEWIDPDLFRFIPDPDAPFTVTRPGKPDIVPGTFETDGGSVPYPLRAFPAYSPWGYAPAFIAHDWLFEAHHCGLPGYDGYTLDDAADVMSELVKAMMQTDPATPPDRLVLYTMDVAVRSDVARRMWDTGRCTMPAETGLRTLRRAAPIAVWELDFDRPR